MEPQSPDKNRMFVMINDKGLHHVKYSNKILIKRLAIKPVNRAWNPPEKGEDLYQVWYIETSK